MTSRVGWLGLTLTLLHTLAWGQAAPAPKPWPEALSPTTAEQWQSYAEALKRDRDQLELDTAIALAKAEKARKAWEAVVKELEGLKAEQSKHAAPDREKQ